MATVLVVDDEPGMRNFLVKTLSPRAGQVLEAGSAEEAEDLLRRHRCDLLILDITLPGKSGIALLKELREQGDPCEVVLITAFADLDTAIEALRAGAGDFLLKPFRVTQVLNAFRHGLDRARLKRENWVLRRSLSQRTPPADGLIGRSIVIKGLQAALHRVATVLVVDDEPGMRNFLVKTLSPRGRRRFHGAADRRIGDWQGACCTGVAPPVSPRGRALRAGQLRARIAAGAGN
jgi:CheY-like chemotaxis protein